MWALPKMRCAFAFVVQMNLSVLLIGVFVQDPTTGEVKPKPGQDDPAKGEDALRSVTDESVPQEPTIRPQWAASVRRK